MTFVTPRSTIILTSSVTLAWILSLADWTKLWMKWNVNIKIDMKMPQNCKKRNNVAQICLTVVMGYTWKVLNYVVECRCFIFWMSYDTVTKNMQQTIQNLKTENIPLGFCTLVLFRIDFGEEFALRLETLGEYFQLLEEYFLHKEFQLLD